MEDNRFNQGGQTGDFQYQRHCDFLSYIRPSVETDEKGFNPAIRDAKFRSSGPTGLFAEPGLKNAL